jgi:hypothetical protein
MNFTTRKWIFSTCVTFAWFVSAATSIYANDLVPGVPSLPKSEIAPARELSGKFNGLAGSPGNADALVRGMRTGSPFFLSSGATRTRFDPPAKPMGFGNINIALSLAQAELRGLGIRNPSPTQLHAALSGGVVMTSKGATTLPGVLSLRSAGKGWGQIAHQLGFKLGEVVRPTRAARATREHRGNSGVTHASHKRDGPGERNQSGGFDGSRGGSHGGSSAHRGK